MALYEKKGISIPFVKEKFPRHGIPASYTLAPQEKEKIMVDDIDIIAQHAYIMSRYAVTIYGGTLVKSPSEVLQRYNELFTFDADVNNYQISNELRGIKGRFPKLQHHMVNSEKICSRK